MYKICLISKGAGYLLNTLNLFPANIYQYIYFDSCLYYKYVVQSDPSDVISNSQIIIIELPSLVIHSIRFNGISLHNLFVWDISFESPNKYACICRRHVRNPYELRSHISRMYKAIPSAYSYIYSCIDTLSGQENKYSEFVFNQKYDYWIIFDFALKILKEFPFNCVYRCVYGDLYSFHRILLLIYLGNMRNSRATIDFHIMVVVVCYNQRWFTRTFYRQGLDNKVAYELNKQEIESLIRYLYFVV